MYCIIQFLFFKYIISFYLLFYIHFIFSSRKYIIPFLIFMYKKIGKEVFLYPKLYVCFNFIRHNNNNNCYLMRADSPKAHHLPLVEDVLPFFSDANVDLSCVEREKAYWISLLKRSIRLSCKQKIID